MVINGLQISKLIYLQKESAIVFVLILSVVQTVIEIVLRGSAKAIFCIIYRLTTVNGNEGKTYSLAKPNAMCTIEVMFIAVPFMGR